MRSFRLNTLCWMLGCLAMGLLAACKDGRTDTTNGATPDAETTAEGGFNWAQYVGLYEARNPAGRQGFSIRINLSVDGDGKPFYRMAYTNDANYYLYLVPKFEAYDTLAGEGVFTMVYPAKLPKFNGEQMWWPYPNGEFRIKLAQESGKPVIQLNMKGTLVTLTQVGNAPLQHLQANYVSAAGASKAEKFYLTLDTLTQDSRILKGFQEYDQRFFPIELEVLDAQTGLARVTMKNFIYSPVSTLQTPTKTFKARIVPSRTFPGKDIIVDFGEGREVRYALCEN